MNNNPTNDTNNQRLLILAWLLTTPLTTFQARKELDVMHPAARISELKAQGHNIQKHWTVGDSGKAKHRIASYVLLSAVQS